MKKDGIKDEYPLIRVTREVFNKLKNLDFVKEAENNLLNIKISPSKTIEVLISSYENNKLRVEKWKKKRKS